WLQSQARQALIPQQGLPPSHQQHPRPQISGESPVNQQRHGVPDTQAQQQYHASLHSSIGSSPQSRPCDSSNYTTDVLEMNRFSNASARNTSYENAPQPMTDIPADDKWDFEETNKSSEADGSTKMTL